MLPYMRRCGGEKGWVIEKPNLNTAVEVGPVNQHRNQFVAAERQDNFHKGKFVRADGDRLDPEALAVFFAPFVQFLSGFCHRYDVHRETIRGKDHAAKFPRAKMAGDKQDAFAVAAPCFEEMETAPLDHERVKPGRASFGTITEIMQHA